MEGNSGNKEDVFSDAKGISLEEYQQLMTYLMPEIQRAQQQDVNKIREVITQTLTNDFSFIEEKFKNIDSYLQQLRSGQINQNEIEEACSEVFPIIDSEDTQKRIAKSVDQGLVDKFKNLSPAKKALAESGLIGAAGAITPIAIVGAAIAIPVALVALPLVLLYVGLKRAMPSKEEFKKTWQGISHDFKNAIDKVPRFEIHVNRVKTNIEKLLDEPNVAQEQKNFIKEYIVKNDDSKDQLKVDDNKIEAFKRAALTIGVNIDTKALSEKGKSTFDSDYEKLKTQITAIDKDVLESQEMKDTFKDKLTEIKQTKATEKAAKQETSFLDKIKDKLSPNRSSSHIENVEAERRGSNSNQGRNT